MLLLLLLLFLSFFIPAGVIPAEVAHVPLACAQIEVGRQRAPWWLCASICALHHKAQSKKNKARCERRMMEPSRTGVCGIEA